MRDGIVQINARPIRHAFLVDPTDVDSLQRVIEINTFLWGGKFNAIIPTFQNSPENWYDCDNIRISSGGSVIFFFDAEKPIDIIDYWNLRVTGRTVYAIPKQFAQEESIRRFVLDLIGGNATSASNAEADSTAWIKHIEFHRRVIKSSSVFDEEFLEFFNEFFNSNEYMQFQGNYPPMWEKLPPDDTRAMRSFSAGTAYHDIFDLPSNDGVIVKTLAPHIKTQSSFTHTPRFANEIYVSVYNDKLIATSVLPEGFKDMSLFFEPDTNVRASKNNLVRLVHEPEYHYQIWLPPSEVILDSWMESHGWEIEISNAGHIVTQMIKRLGIGFFQVFAIKGIIDLLGKMNNGKSLLQENLLDKLDMIVQERCDDGETLEYDAANILKRLVDANVLQPGMKMACPNCRQKSWFSIKHTYEHKKRRYYRDTT